MSQLPETTSDTVSEHVRHVSTLDDTTVFLEGIRGLVTYVLTICINITNYWLAKRHTVALLSGVRVTKIIFTPKTNIITYIFITKRQRISSNQNSTGVVMVLWMYDVHFLTASACFLKCGPNMQKYLFGTIA